MPYRVNNLAVHNTPREIVYFFDANIWLLLLGIQPSPKPYEVHYIEFFKKVTHSNAVILLPAMLVSETVNRMLMVEMRKYAHTKGDTIDSTYFKKKYRLTPEFKIKLQAIYDDIGIYASSCSLINDNFGNVNFGQKDLFTVVGPITEFNDHYMLKLAIQNSATIVTHDFDFWVEDVDILTLNRGIIDRS